MLPSNPLLSILIATKNRIPYCISAIKSILSFNDTDFELIIQDNSDTKELSSYIDRNILDNRLIYNYTPPPFSSIDNFNSVIGMASGEYLCLIGDDDGINPEILKIVRWASRNKIDAIVPEIRATYCWPDACDIVLDHKGGNGVLQITMITGRVNQYNSSSEVKKLMNNGAQDYLSFNLPKLYHGIVKKEMLDKIKEVTGKYIGGLSPDIYISVALTSLGIKVIKIDYPLTIPGVCGVSTSSDSVNGKHTGQLRKAPHFRDRGQYFWSSLVPEIYSVETIWADSAIASLNDMKRFKLLSKFDITTLTVILLQRHKAYSKIILKNYFDNKSSNHLTKIYYIVLLLNKYIKLQFINTLSRLFIKLKNEISKVVRFNKVKNISKANFHNVGNISQATDELSKYLSKQSLSIDIIIKRLDILMGDIQKKI